MRWIPDGRADAPAKDPEADLVEEVDRLLRSVSLLVRRRGRMSLEGSRVTPPQFNALQAVARAGGLTMGELCQQLYLASSTVTALVDRLEEAGLVERVRDGHDKRVVRLSVTEAGYRVMDQVMSARIAYLRTVLDRLDDPDQRCLVESLRRIHREMEVDAL